MFPTRNTPIAMVNGISYIFPYEIDFNLSNLKGYCLQWEERIIRDYNLVIYGLSENLVKFIIFKPESNHTVCLGKLQTNFIINYHDF